MSLGLARALRRLTPTPLGQLIVDKSMSLNPSRSKQVVLGLDLERRLEPYAVMDNGSGLGVLLTASEVRALLDRQWLDKLQCHLKRPAVPGDCRTSGDGTDFRLVTLRGCEPGMRISTREESGRRSFVLLGYESCKRICVLAPVILRYMEHLDRTKQRCRDSMIIILDDLASELEKRGGTKSVAEELIARNAEKLASSSQYDVQLDLALDLHFRYREFLIGMLCGYCGVD